MTNRSVALKQPIQHCVITLEFLKGSFGVFKNPCAYQSRPSTRRIESTVGVGETAEYWKGVLVAELLRTISNKVLAYADIRQG